jgi:hypothetical protein
MRDMSWTVDEAGLNSQPSQEIFSFLQVHTGSGAHPAYYPMRTVDYFFEVKTTGALTI